MEIKLDPESLKGKSLMVATPMYGGNCKGEFTRCLMELARLCDQFGVPMGTLFVYNASLIGRGRNDLADTFLKSEYTHMLFIDADIVFDPKDVLICLATDKELTGGPYPMKTIDWSWTRDLLLERPDVKASEMGQLSRFFHFNFKQPVENLQFTASEMLEVENVSTGFMMIKREVFDAIRTRWPDQEYRLDYAIDVTEGTTKVVYNYFATPVEDGVLLSEDYYFCKRWKETGGKIWLAPWMKMQHIGDYFYGGLGLFPSMAAEMIVKTRRDRVAVEAEAAAIEAAKTEK